MKITDLKCTILGKNPVVRITTDQGLCGWGEAESSKPYLKPHVLFYRDLIQVSFNTCIDDSNLICYEHRNILILFQDFV